MTNFELLTVSFFSIFFVLALLRRLWNQSLQQRFVFRIFELRDRLRALAIEGKIDDWVFDCLDYSFSRTINEAYYITLFNTLLNKFRVEDTKEFVQFRDKLTSAIESNSELKSILQSYTRTVHEYITDQHFVSYMYFVKPVVTLIIGANNAKLVIKNAIQTTLFKDDNSTHRHSMLANG